MEHWLFLKDSLSREIQALQDLLLLSEQEKEAVIQNDVQSISSIVDQQQSILNALNSIRSERERRMETLFADLFAPDKPLQWNTILNAAPDAIRDELKQLLTQLESAADKLRTITDLNKKLIDTQLQYTNYCINLITGQGGMPGTYSGSGTLKEEAAHSIFDQSV